AAAVPGVDPVPLVPRPGGQGPAEGVRPLRDLPADRRHLYAVHADRPARTVGVGPVRRDLDPGPGRGGVQALLHRPLQAPVHAGLRRHGLAGAGGDQAGAGGARRLDLRLAGRRRAVLHPGHGLLPPRVYPLLARDLAPVLHRRQRLPLRRGDGAGGDASLTAPFYHRRTIATAEPRAMIKSLLIPACLLLAACQAQTPEPVPVEAQPDPAEAEALAADGEVIASYACADGNSVDLVREGRVARLALSDGRTIRLGEMAGSEPRAWADVGVRSAER